LVDTEVKLTLEQLQEQLKSAMASGNMPEVIRLSQVVTKATKGASSVELEAKKGQITDLGEKIKLAFQSSIIDKFGMDIVALVGEKKAIIKLDWDYEGQTPTCKIVKGIAGTRKAGAKGGGNPQKFAMSSDDLIAKHGDAPFKKDEAGNTSQTMKQAWDATTDKNARYAIRQAMIKLET
jgi:hypothetical protein